MTFISPPAYQQGGTYSARTDRLSVISGLLGYHGNSADEATPLRTRSGVRPSYQNQQLAVTAQATPAMSVQLSAGTGWIENKDLAAYGAYTVVNDGPINLPIAAASTTQYRKDTVVVQVLDAETLGTVNSAAPLVVQGPYAATAGATTRGTLPPNCLVLADIAVDANVTSITSAKISDVRQYQVAAGGMLPVLSTALPDHPAPGQMFYATDTNVLYYATVSGALRQMPFGGSTGVGMTLTKEKSSNQPSTNTTLTNDTSLFTLLQANSTYLMDGWIVYDGVSGGGDLKMDWTIPSGATMLWSSNGPATGGTAAYASHTTTVGSGPLNLGTYGFGIAYTNASIRGRIVTGATSGNLQFRWSQNTANATATTVYAGSWIRLLRTA